ncbi:hypothetical protein CANARDRAFT_187657, partial [[Candida] arabinofermentans NRRL YB-2248]
LIYILQYILFLCTTVSATSFSSKDSTLFSCILATTTLKFDYQTPPKQSTFWFPICNYEPLIGTLLVCFDEILLADSDTYKPENLKLLDYTYSTYEKSCYNHAQTIFSRDDLIQKYNNATQFLIDSESLKDDNIGVDETLLHNPVHLDRQLVSSYSSSYKTFFANYVSSTRYCDLACGYWILVLMIIGTIRKLPLKLINNKFVNNYRSKISLPTVNGYHMKPFNETSLQFFNCLLPTTLEAVILLLYLALIVFFCTIDYQITNHSMLLGSKEAQLFRYIADRTGLLAFAQLPLLFLFGGRNNLLMRLTDINFNSFIIYHKWISRFMVILALIHAHTYAEYFFIHKRLDYERTQAFWKFGERCLLAGILMLLQGVYFFRKKFYELFLVIHIILALLFLIGAYLHCVKVGFLEWIYLSSGIWAADRVWRIVTLYKFGKTKAIFELQDNSIKITIPKPEYWKGYPGCFIYLYIPDLKFTYKIWESHPFTIYSSETEIRVYIKPKTGMTANLQRYLAQQLNNTAELNVLVEGPYGHETELSRYESSLIIAAGSGIPGPYYHAVHLLKHYEKVKCKGRIEFVWITKDLKSIEFFRDELIELQNLDTDSSIDKYIYLTRETSPSIDCYADDRMEVEIGFDSQGNIIRETTPLFQKKNQDHKLANYEELLESYRFLRQKPNLQKLFEEKLRGDRECGAKDLGVVICGNDLIVDAVRDLIGSMVGKGDGVWIDLYEELQVW